MADTAVETATLNAMSPGGGMTEAWVSPLIGVRVYLNGTSIVTYIRTTDGGATWGTPTPCFTNAGVRFTWFFDRVSPVRATGNLLHLLQLEATDGVARYRTIDVSTETLGTEQAVASTAAAQTALNSGSALALSVARDGTIFACGRTNATVDTAWAHISTDLGAIWAPLAASPFENVLDDKFWMFPWNTDNAHCGGIYFDDSATELSTKVWNGTTWSETSISTGVDPGSDSTAYIEQHFHATMRHSDSVVLVASWNAVQSATADLQTWTVPTDSTTPSATATTNVLTDTNESGGVRLMVHQPTGHVYATYLLGSTTWEDTVLPYYKISTDGMSTWGSAVALSEDAAEDHRALSSTDSITSLGGRFQPSWWDDDDNDLFINLNTDIALDAVVATGSAGERGVQRGVRRGMRRGARRAA